MAYNPSTQIQTDALNSLTPEQYMHKVRAYLSTHDLNPHNPKEVIAVPDSQACLGGACSCMSSPTKAQEQRMTQGRLKQPMNRLELTTREKAVIMNAPAESGMFLNNIPMV